MLPAPRTETVEQRDLQRQVTLLDLVDRVLDKGAVVRGQIMLSVADVDLVSLDLRLLLGAVQTWRDTS
jgi:hypothetical protein